MQYSRHKSKHPAAHRRPLLQAMGLAVGAVALVGSLSLTDRVHAGAPAPQPAPAPVDAPPVPEGLKGIPVPMPASIGEYVASQPAIIRLGKALFWDMQLGSDGKTACASCHFQAGADPRTRNQISPGLNRVNPNLTPNPDFSFQLGGPNYQLRVDDFPFHKFSNPGDRNSPVVRTHNDVASSQGIFKSQFVGVTAGAVADSFTLSGDAVYQINGLQTRRVEPRNTPTMINAVFNFRNFWDGRATYLFNGVSPFGAMDEAARVYKNTGTLVSNVQPVQIRLEKASLASLATGPALSDLEMSAAGRSWPHIGKRLLAARPLVQQKVATNDSTLAAVRHSTGVGLNGTYLSMVKEAFRPEWWNGTQTVTIAGQTYSQAEANFSLFFGLAIQAYGATLVSDDSPFDRYMAGNATAMSADAAAGMGVFFGKGKCAECHGGAEFTNASVRKILKDGPMARMVMGNGGIAVYDEGFYNISVTKTLEDISNGATNPVGRPMATSRLAQQVSAAEFQRLIGIAPNLAVSPTERIAVNGAYKTPTIRNAELTAPYFNNGDSLTLEQVVDFYNRGGNHFQNNFADVDAEITPLNLTDTEKRQLVAFIKATTDERVRFERAPFDHPQLFVPNGHAVDALGKGINDGGKAKEIWMEVPAVGSTGRTSPPASFAATLTPTRYFSLVAQHSSKCVELDGGLPYDGINIHQFTCADVDKQRWEEVPVAGGGFMLRNRQSERCMEVAGGSTGDGANIFQWTCKGTPQQVFSWSGSQLKAKHSGKCITVLSNLTHDWANVVQWTCTAATSTAKNDKFTKRP